MSREAIFHDDHFIMFWLLNTKYQEKLLRGTVIRLKQLLAVLTNKQEIKTSYLLFAVVPVSTRVGSSIVQPEYCREKWIGEREGEEEQAHDPDREHDEYFLQHHQGAFHIASTDAGNHAPQP